MTKKSMVHPPLIIMLLLLGLGIGSVVAQLEELEYAAIRGWHKDCEQVNETLSLCGDSLAVIPNDLALYFDFETCYSNPYLKKRSVSFLGQGTDGGTATPMIYSLIFTDEAELLNDYIPTNCTAYGACDCNSPPSLGEVRAQILQDKACSNQKAFFNCSVAPFEIMEDTCYVPSTYSTTETTLGISEFFCSMAAVIDLNPPPDNISPSGADISPSGPSAQEPVFVRDVENVTKADNNSIFVQLQELGFVTIRGWWHDCDDSSSQLCGNSTTMIGTTSDDYLYFDFETCYSNPYLGQRSLSFLGKDIDGQAEIYSLIFTDSAIEAGDYIPTDCDEKGACSCKSPSALGALRAQILANRTCENMDGVYSCIMSPFLKKDNICYVPATDTFQLADGTEQLFCSMAAMVEVAHVATAPTPSLVALGNPSNAASTSAPSPSPTSAVATDMGATGAPVKELSNSTTNSDGPISTVEIPASAAALDYTAITGWWNSCDGTNNSCSQAINIRFEVPLYLNVDTCYVNPLIDHRAVTFYLTSRKGKAFSFSLMFDGIDDWNQMQPTDCNENGECSCTSPGALNTVHEELKSSLKCKDGTGYKCIRTDFVGLASNCYIPTMLTRSNGSPNCAMAASLQQIPPVDAPELDGEAEFPKDPPSLSAAQRSPRGFGAGLTIGLATVVGLGFIVFVAVVLRNRQEKAFDGDTLQRQDSERKKTNIWDTVGRRSTVTSRFSTAPLPPTRIPENNLEWTRAKSEDINDLMFDD